LRRARAAWRRSVVALRDQVRPALGGQPDRTKPGPPPATSKRLRARTAANAATASAADVIRHSDSTAPETNADGNFTSRIDWATLLNHIHDVNALACPCGGRLRFIALVVDPGVASSILGSLNLPAAPPLIARARSPDFYDAMPDYGAPTSP
jgi:hypothetical protein